MKIGVMLAGVNTKFWTAAAQAAEDAGFESVWLPEHLVFPVEMKGSPHAGDAHPPIPSNTPAFDALMALAAIAATTKNVRLGTNVYNIGLRHPFVTARAITTLDVALGRPGRVRHRRQLARGGVGRDRPRLRDPRPPGRRDHRHLPATLDRRRGGAPRRVLRLRRR